MNFSGASLYAALFALCTAVFWGTYGPLLQSGHQLMDPEHVMGTGGRLRPFICVGVAYLLVAIVGPIIVMYTTGIDRGAGVFHHWTFSGIVWSTIAGGAGALGAFTLIMALGAGGPRSVAYVMPMVFGFAPMISTLTGMYFNKTFNQMSPFFAAGLILIVAGAITILFTAPKPKPKPAGSHAHSTPAAVEQVAKSDANQPLTNSKKS
jgi:hypothetical protein